MLTPDGCRNRRTRLWTALGGAADEILISEPRHLMYFAGFHAPPFIFRTQNASALLLLRADGSSTLVVDNMLAAYAESAHVDGRVVADWYDGKASAPERQQVLVDAGRRACIGGRCAFDQMVPSQLSIELSAAGRVASIPSINALAWQLMRRKDDDELALLRRIVSAMEAGFRAARADLHAGATELHAYSLVSAAVVDALGEQALVYGDFAAGPRAEAKGGVPTPRQIGAGELFILDYSAVLGGYRADFTNTWVVDGAASDPQRQLWHACREALAAGEACLRPGVPGREVHAALTSVFRQHGVADAFPHHSGHGIGLGHPEPPYFTAASTDVIEAGDVVTLEPGLYVPGVGGMRFERNYAITDAGFELLSHHHLGLE